MRAILLQLFLCCLAIRGFGKAPAAPSLEPGQAMGQRARPSASSESAERRAPAESRARQQVPAPGGAADATRHGSVGSGYRTSPRPEASDSLVLLLSKTYSSGNWQLELTWSGGASPYTVSYSTDPSFQSGAQTLALEYTGTSYGQPATAGSTIECFEVTDASVVSLPAQTLGYDPIPPPVTPQFVNQDYWWGDSLTLDSGYLDPIAKENLVHFWDRPTRPDTVSGVTGSFATSLTVDHIPDDSRSFWVIAESRGSGSSYAESPTLNLYAKNISFTDITSLTWAPCEGSPDKGSVWVAASGGIYEVDLFRRIPALTPQATGTKMYLSRPTNMTNPAATHQILYVDGVSGVTEVKQINACTGAFSTFAQTSDSQFTRPIWPVGIAVNQDGSCCYVADANQGKIVRIPAGNVGNITDNWGSRSFGLNDPTGMDVGLDGHVWLAESNGRLWQIISQNYPYPMGWIDPGANCLDIDKDVSTSGNTIYVWDTVPFTDAYNRNGIEDVAGTPTRYHGGTVFGQADGKLRLDPVWLYSFSRHFPQRVLLSAQGQPVPYPSPYQSADRIIEIRVRGWPGLPTQLRVIDPPDFAAYAPDGGWCGATGYPACTAAPPYEGKDNLGMSDYGLTTDPSGAGASPALKVYPASNYYAIAYLKVPASISGNNFQVEATKCKADGTVLDKKVLNLSPVFTTWKRVYVERDKMFRRGNLLDSDVVAPPAGQLYLRRWDSTTPESDASMYVQGGDLVAVFDVDYPYPSGGFETSVISTSPAPAFYNAPLPGGGTQSVLQVYLDRTLTNTYSASPLTFASGASAAVGVLYSADGLINDTSSNQINGPASAFYDADMRDIQQPFGDAFVEFIGQASGMGAVPFISNAIPTFYVDVSGGGNVEPGKTMRKNFQYLWLQNKYTTNYLHLLGVRGPEYPASGVMGFSRRWALYTFIHDETILQYQPDPSLRPKFERNVNDHEHGHQFRVNDCTGQHDTRPAWCNDPPNSSCANQPCLMAPDAGGPIYSMDDINRFCKEDLLLDSSCGDGSAAIRRTGDLVKTE